MEERKEYSEVYGWMPREIVNRLDEDIKREMFVEYILRKPTDTGWFITAAVVKALGEDFLEYLFTSVIECIQDEDGVPVKEEVMAVITGLLESFATDSNVLHCFVDDYFEKTGNKPVVDLTGIVTPEKKMPERDAKGRFVKKN